MEFIQIIEGRAADMDALRAIDEEWHRATKGKRTVRRSILTRDRNDPNRFVVVVFFDSYESAMANSSLPETQQFAEKLAAAVEAPLKFYDMDLIEDKAD